jgi:hypothetical protein
MSIRNDDAFELAELERERQDRLCKRCGCEDCPDSKTCSDNVIAQRNDTISVLKARLTEYKDGTEKLHAQSDTSKKMFDEAVVKLEQRDWTIELQKATIKELQDKIRQLENDCLELGMINAAVSAVLKGESVSDFEESFDMVRQALDMRTREQSLRDIVNARAAFDSGVSAETNTTVAIDNDKVKPQYVSAGCAYPIGAKEPIPPFDCSVCPAAAISGDNSGVCTDSMCIEERDKYNIEHQSEIDLPTDDSDDEHEGCKDYWCDCDPCAGAMRAEKKHWKEDALEEAAKVCDRDADRWNNYPVTNKEAMASCVALRDAARAIRALKKG